MAVSAAWKDHERQTAKRLGGLRAGPTGKVGSDVLHPLWAIECKERATVPQWLHAAVAQAAGSARGRQVPIVVLHELGARHDGDYVVVRLKDFEELYGALFGAGEGENK